MFARNSLPYASYAAHHYVACTVTHPAQPMDPLFSLRFNAPITRRLLWDLSPRRIYIWTYIHTCALGTCVRFSFSCSRDFTQRTRVVSVNPLAAGSLAPFLSFLCFLQKIGFFFVRFFPARVHTRANYFSDRQRCLSSTSEKAQTNSR